MAKQVLFGRVHSLTWITFFAAMALGWLLQTSHAADDAVKTKTIATPVEIPGVHNAFRVSAKIYSGSQPEGDEAFAAIASLGVKTIVSVDGSKPDIDAARKHGLRYIHLPYGYDGIPTNRVVELSKLAGEDLGPFFVHCHHGLHRGPAAVAVMCEAAEGWSPDKAVAWLIEAGTANDYPGLYRAASGYKSPSKEALTAVKTFPEVTQPTTLVDAMVKIDEHFSNLKLAQKAAWKTPPGHADIAPAHEATMLWEQFKELARTDDTTKRLGDYRAMLTDAEKAAEALRERLRAPQDLVQLEATFKKVGAACAACHKKYRNE
ncbi:MAG: cytochrome c [Verrucomicrobiota bacterium]